ncbi:MAG: hypothetical protein Q4D61_06650 [Cardiobacteriaceae bacterium]|nr:hypothetical protein [Cardiobacteriaceae bacterium]
MQSYAERRRRERQSANIGARLLQQGQHIVYKIPGLAPGEAILEYPDGRTFLIVTKNGRRISQRPWQPS